MIINFIVPTVYSNIKSIQVWGGEDNEPMFMDKSIFQSNQIVEVH